jgi:hypothetical protein
MSKPKSRARLAALSFTEKVEILEKLRDRSRSLALVHLILVPGLNDPWSPAQRETLQCEAQKYLSVHLKGGAPNASRAALHAILRGWLETGSRREISFEFFSQGDRRRRNISCVEDLASLIGQDRVPSDFLRGLGAIAHDV